MEHFSFYQGNATRCRSKQEIIHGNVLGITWHVFRATRVGKKSQAAAIFLLNERARTMGLDISKH